MSGAPARQLSAVESPLRRDPNPGLLLATLHGVYDLAWLLLVALGAPWLAWRSRRRPFARMVGERLGLGLGPPPNPGDRPRVLVHGVSVGEIKASQSLVRRLVSERPDLEVVLSTTTDTGQQVARTLFPELRVVRFPADPSPVVARFFARLRPWVVVLVELEIWPNFLRAANRRGIPVVVVNGRITDRSFGRYRVFRSLFPQFDRISLFCAQSATYAERFRRLGVPERRIVVTGNIKVDGLQVGRVDPGSELQRLLGTTDGRPLVVAGSTHAPEERLVVETCRRHLPDARLVVVPRHPGRAAEVVRELEALGPRPQRLTELRQGLEAPDPQRVAVVDTIGELERVYGLADAAFVGGSLVPHGGQNVLEPAAQGLPVLFGPHVANFAQEVALLRDSAAARPVADAEELGQALAELLRDPTRAAALGAAAAAVVAAQRGATEETWSALAAYLPVRAAARDTATGAALPHP